MFGKDMSTYSKFKFTFQSCLKVKDTKNQHFAAQ
jgi:hypothetical protein